MNSFNHLEFIIVLLIDLFIIHTWKPQLKCKLLCRLHNDYYDALWKKQSQPSNIWWCIACVQCLTLASLSSSSARCCWDPGGNELLLLSSTKWWASATCALVVSCHALPCPNMCVCLERFSPNLLYHNIFCQYSTQVEEAADTEVISSQASLCSKINVIGKLMCIFTVGQFGTDSIFIKYYHNCTF